MSSCKFEGGKYKGKTEVKAHLRHNDISMERRTIAKKKNKHIDLTKCSANFNILGLSYEERCRKYDARIAYLDSNGNTNKRKDRVTMQCIEIPVPKDLPYDRYHDWFIRVAELLRAKYREENFIDADIHYDEVHEYREPETKELVVSRVHGHYMFVPEVNGSLNCKQMSLRKNMKALNREVEEMTQKEFGCSFMTGKKYKSYKTVEELKQESENAELLYQMGLEQMGLDIRRASIKDTEAALAAQKKELETKEEELLTTNNMLLEWQARLEKREATVSDLELQKKELEAKEEKLLATNNRLSDWQDKLKQREIAVSDLELQKKELETKREELLVINNRLATWQENLKQREAAVSDLELQKKEILQEKESVQNQQALLKSAVEAVTEIPKMDDLIQTVLRRASVEAPIFKGSPITKSMSAIEYLNQLQASQRMRTELKLHQSGYTDTDWLLKMKSDGKDFQFGL